VSCTCWVCGSGGVHGWMYVKETGHLRGTPENVHCTTVRGYEMQISRAAS